MGAVVARRLRETLNEEAICGNHSMSPLREPGKDNIQIMFRLVRRGVALFPDRHRVSSSMSVWREEDTHGHWSILNLVQGPTEDVVS